MIQNARSGVLRSASQLLRYLRSSNGDSECLDNNLVLSSVIKLITGMLRSGNGDLSRTMVLQNGPDGNLCIDSVIIVITCDVLVI